MINASGTLGQRIEPGATVHLEVKYGFIKLLTKEVDLCEFAGEVDLKCPIEKGDMQLSKEVNLPGVIPPGDYTVLANVLTKGGDVVTCLTAKVHFG